MPRYTLHGWSLLIGAIRKDESVRLNPLRKALERFTQAACQRITGDTKLFAVLQSPWLQISGDVGPAGGSFSLDTVSRPRPVLMTPAEQVVSALPEASAVVSELQGLPEWVELLPSHGPEAPAFDEVAYIRSKFVVGFLKRYLQVALKAVYDPASFADTFSALAIVLIDRQLEERLMIPLGGLTWLCNQQAVALDEQTRIRRLTSADREVLLNANRDPIMGPTGFDSQTFLWAQSAVEANWRVPLHSVLLEETNFERAFDVITSLRLAAPGLVSAASCHASSPFTGWYSSGKVYRPIPYRANAAVGTYNFDDDTVKHLVMVYTALRKLVPADRKKIELSIERFHRSFDVRRPEERVVDLMIALDSVLGTVGPGSTYKLSVRVAAYVGTDKQDRIRLKNLIIEAYRIRSEIVHGVTAAPRSKGLPSLLIELEDAVRRVLRRAVGEAASSVRSISDIPHFIDDDLVLGSPR